MTDFIGNYTHIPIGDFRALRNWGIYKEAPVIIDMGLSSSVQDRYYNWGKNK